MEQKNKYDSLEIEIEMNEESKRAQVGENAHAPEAEVKKASEAASEYSYYEEDEEEADEAANSASGQTDVQMAPRA